MTEQLTPQQIIERLADLIPKRDEAVRIIDEMESAFKAEAAEAYTREKRLKTEVEDFKAMLRLVVGETGEKVQGVTLAHTQQVSYDKDALEAIVAWCCEYAPALLTLKGSADIRKWFFQSPIQTISVKGKPAAVLIVESVDEDGTEHHKAVPCPFYLVQDVQVRVSESGIVTGVDQERWNAEHEQDI